MKKDNEENENEKDNEENEESGSEENMPAPEIEAAEELELAWEFLEFARILYSKLKNPDNIGLSNVHQSLGNVAIESNNIELALKEYAECADLRIKDLGENDRLLAEVYYLIGSTYSYTKDLEKSKEFFEKAQNILKFNLKETEEKGDHKESSNLKEIINELDERILELSNTDDNESNNSLPPITPEKEENVKDLTSNIKKKSIKKKIWRTRRK